MSQHCDLDQLLDRCACSASTTGSMDCWVILRTQIAQAPRVEAMRTQLMARSISQGSPSTEAWLELVGSKDGPLCTEPLLQQLQEAGEAAAGRRRSPRKQRQQQQQQKDLQQPPEQVRQVLIPHCLHRIGANVGG
eukprot:1153119-Pelagomonas_calceolata.AAC.3